MATSSSKLIIIRGLPGSGKSTFAKTLLGPARMGDTYMAHIEADMFFVVNGEYCYDGMKIGEAHHWCREATRNYLNAGYNVIVSNTFTRMKEMAPYLEMAKELDCELVVYRCAGNYGSIHGIPDRVMENMRGRFVDFEGEIFV